MKRFEYFEPVSLEEALSLVSKYKASVKLLAGGTELLPKMKRKAISPEYVINLKRIDELRDIEVKNGVLKIGALTTLRELEKSPLVCQGAESLVAALRDVASPNIRQAATIGGNLCQGPKCEYYNNRYLWGLPPCYLAGGQVCNAIKGAKRCTAMSPVDTGPAFMSLDAKVEIASKSGIRTMPLEDLFVGPGVTILSPDEILTTINLPCMQKGDSAIYLKHSARGTIDYAIASVGVKIVFPPESDVCSEARVVLGAVDNKPLRIQEAEKILKGKKIDEKLIDEVALLAAKAPRPWSDIHASSAYRRKIVKILVKNALKQALTKVNYLC